MVLGHINGWMEGKAKRKKIHMLFQLIFRSVYQGDVCRGRRHGTGIFRHGQSPLTYEGEWNMGNMHGKVC
jgi:hypothetical protein